MKEKQHPRSKFLSGSSASQVRKLFTHVELIKSYSIEAGKEICQKINLLKKTRLLEKIEEITLIFS